MGTSLRGTFLYRSSHFPAALAQLYTTPTSFQKARLHEQRTAILGQLKTAFAREDTHAEWAMDSVLALPAIPGSRSPVCPPDATKLPLWSSSRLVRRAGPIG
jgi:hypothetical protein